MRKEEYILKYGEEAYKKSREYYKEYYQTHKDKAREYNKEYRERNKDILREKEREYRKKNIDKIREKDRIRQKGRIYRRRTGVGRLRHLSSFYKCMDRKKGFDISKNVTGSWIARYIIGNRCTYCGDDNIEHLGLDRIDNTRPHTEDNVVCSCFLCNTTRADRYTVDEFIEIMKDKRKS